MIKNKKPEIRFKGFSEEWEEKELGEIYTFQYGQFNNNPSNGGIYPVYGANGIIGKYSKFNAENSIVIGHMGEYAGSVIWVEGKYFVTYNGTITTPKNDEVKPKYGYYMLHRLNIYKICGGSGQPFLAYDKLNKLKGVFPVFIEEQVKISDLFSNLDSLITLHQRKYDKLGILKKAMLEKMFPKNGADVPEIRFKGFEGAWEEKTLGEIIDLRGGRDYKHLPNGNIPVYGTGGYMLSVNEALSYDKDAIGIGRKGTIDKPFLLKAPFWTVDTLFYAVPMETNNLDFIYDIFQKINWKHKNEATGVPSLSKVAINGIQVLIPKREEQEKIGNYFKNLDNLLTLHQGELGKLKNLKKAMLKKMFV